MRKKVFITGITGQDGSYLAELLIAKGYEVHGLVRRSSLIKTDRIDHLYEDSHSRSSLQLHYGDMVDGASLTRVIKMVEPDEVYNLAAQSHVAVSFETPEYTADAVGLGALRILEAIRLLGFTSTTRFYQASTSELYGLVDDASAQTEITNFYPRSPYGVAKLYAHWITVNYREAYGLFACNGILFNHESPRRGETFVTRKVTRAVKAIYEGRQDILYLGNLNALRDWGHAKEFVEMQWMMLQQPSPKDYVIATGRQSSVRDFVRLAFEVVGVAVEFEGEGVEECGIAKRVAPTGCFGPSAIKPGSVVCKVDPRYFRPSEVETLLGDASKARDELNWSPRVSLDELVNEMVLAEFNLAG